MRVLALCDGACYYIDDHDLETLKRVSPGLARLVKDAHGHARTHFVCPTCGQICPLTLRALHDCSPADPTREGKAPPTQ